MAEVTLTFRTQPHQTIPQGDWHTAVLLAGRGAGKTWNATRWVLTQALTYPGTTWLAVGRTWAEALRILAEGEGGLKWHILGDHQRPSVEFTLEGGTWDNAFTRSPGLMQLRLANGSVIRLASADRPNSLRGTNAHGAVADEVAFWDREALHMLRLAVRLSLPDGSPARVLMATTPAGQNWWADEWLDRAPMPGVIYIAGADEGMMPPHPPPSSLANRFTDKAWRDALLSMYEGTDLYQQEVLGQVLSMKGQIYKGLSPIKHTRAGYEDTGFEWPTPSTADQIIAGQDLGSEHPSALVVLARQAETWCVVAEVVEPAPTEAAWHSMISATLEQWRPEMIYSDRNFPQTTNAQRGRGLTIVDADKSSGSVIEGIREVQKVLSASQLRIDTEACPKLWRELRGYRWATTAQGDPVVPERPVKRADDASDALRYALFMVANRRTRRLLFS